MSLLYKDKKDQTVEVSIKQKDGVIELEFSSDCGKFGTDEPLAGYKLTTRRLLEIFGERDDYTDKELEQ